MLHDYIKNSKYSEQLQYLHSTWYYFKELKTDQSLKILKIFEEEMEFAVSEGFSLDDRNFRKEAIPANAQFMIEPNYDGGPLKNIRWVVDVHLIPLVLENGDQFETGQAFRFAWMCRNNER